MIGGKHMNSFSHKILTKDIQAFYYLNTRIKSQILNKIMLLITHLGGAFFTILLAILCILIKPGFNPIIGWEIILVLSSSHLFVHIIKRLINRQRPHVKLNNIELLVDPFEPYSFPSGHTTASFSVALILSFYLPILSPVLLTLALLVAISRVYLGVHYPLDILFGVIIAVIFVIIIHYGLYYYIERYLLEF